MKRSSGTRMRYAICLLALAACVSCSGPVVTAVGSSNDLVIIHDEGALDIAEATVAALEAEQSWLLGEPRFKTVLTTAREAGDLRNIRHVLLVGTWDQKPVSNMARSVFPGLDRSAPPELLTTRDVWAKRQVVAAVISSDAASLMEFLASHAEEIRSTLEASAIDRLSDSLRKTADDAGMTDALLDRFGWSLSPPTGYEFFTTNEADGFVFFRRTRPDRTVFIYWMDGGPEFVSEQFVLAMREELATNYFDGDAISWERPVEAVHREFLGVPAVRVSGWWGNKALVGGGPFRTYCFHDTKSGRVYLLDVSLFAPSYDKTSLMRNLDAIAHTFALE